MILLPSSTVISAVGSNVAFTCLSLSVDIQQIIWRINGSELQDLNNDYNITTGISNRRGSIDVSNLVPEFNSTTFQSEATFTTGAVAFSEESTLIVQGQCFSCQL